MGTHLLMSFKHLSNTGFKKWLAASIFFYFFLVLNLLEPFQIDLNGFYLPAILVLSSFGIVSGLGVLFLEFTIQPDLEKFILNWNLATALLWFIFEIIFLSFLIWIYTLLLHHYMNGWQGIYFPEIEAKQLIPKYLALNIVWAFICIPNIYFAISNKIKSVNNASKEVEETILLPSDNQNDRFRIKISQIICFQTFDNYLKVIFLTESNKLDSKLVRSSLKKMQQQLDSELLIRCHQSFLINKNFITAMKSNNKLQMAYLDFDVLVSRSNIKIIQNTLPITE